MSSTPHRAAPGHDDHAHGGHAHHDHTKLYYKVFGALLVLTVVTVLVSLADLGALSFPVAIIVALCKASLVAAFFMHLKDDERFNAFIFVGSTFFLMILLGFNYLDFNSRDVIVAEEGNHEFYLDLNYDATASDQVDPQVIGSTDEDTPPAAAGHGGGAGEHGGGATDQGVEIPPPGTAPSTGAPQDGAPVPVPPVETPTPTPPGGP